MNGRYIGIGPIKAISVDLKLSLIIFNDKALLHDWFFVRALDCLNNANKNWVFQKFPIKVLCIQDFRFILLSKIKC